MPSSYRLGLPAWAFPGWRGRYFEDRPSALASYARVFDAVEGNTTFYRVPEPRTVAGWRQATADRDFEFCFKLPRAVTHERWPDLAVLQAFLAAIAPLGERLGPLLLQFPAGVGPAQLARFEAVFAAVCERHRAVVEVRHPEFFGAAELGPLLDRFGLGRVVLDTRALYGGDPNHPDVRAARHEKPDLPVRPEARNGIAFLRLVLHPDAPGNEGYLVEWADRVAEYLAGGERVYVMIHCPNNLHCPEQAAAFHRCLAARRPELAPLPPWPVPQQTRLL